MSRMFNSKKTIVISVVVFILSFMQMESFPQNNWERITEIPTKRNGFATAVVDNEIYLIGGTLFENLKWKPGKIRKGPYGLSTVEVYDPQTNTWQRVADMPTLRHGAKAAVVNGIIYVFGGYNGKDNQGVNRRFLDIVEAYDPQTDTWVRKQDMPVSRFNFELGVAAGRVYLIGGSTGRGQGHEQRTDRVDIYDPATDTWMAGRKMPTRRDPIGVEVVSNRIYVIGGYGWPQIPNNPGPFLTSIEEYNPITNQWRKKNDMLALRTSFGTVVAKDDIYIIGGVDEFHKYLATVGVYHPQTQAWSDIPAMSTPLLPYGAAAVNGKIYVFGGYDGESGEFSPDIMVYDTGFRAVEAVGKLPVRWGALKAESQRQSQRD